MVSMILLLSVNAVNAVCIPSSNLGLIGVQIGGRSETNLYKENASTKARYVASIEFEGSRLGIGVQMGASHPYWTGVCKLSELGCE